ncbi:MAG: response regulator transcription factor [Planctomycetota bacterium]|jgi:two-component system response regulator FixJ
MAKQRVFFVDDEPNIRRTVRETLEPLGLKVNCFADAAECLKNLESQNCDLLITDLRMPEMDGIELLKRARFLTPWVPVLIITGYGDIPTAVEGIKAGAVDFIEKPLEKSDFVKRVESILSENGRHSNGLPGGPLTRSEKRVLKLVIDGRSNKDIANVLKRSRRTVEVHRASAMRKLKVDNVIDLVKRTAEMGLVELPEC